MKEERIIENPKIYAANFINKFIHIITKQWR